MSAHPHLVPFVMLGLALGFGCSDPSASSGNDTTDIAADTADSLDDTSPDTTPDSSDTGTSPDTDTSDTDTFILPDPSRTVVGKSLAEWGASWWRWHYGLETTTHPALDLTGERCSVGQGGSVFFLPGTFEAFGNRTCRVPAGKHIFFPIVATAYDNAGIPRNEHVSPTELQRGVDDYVDSVVTLELVVNGTTWALSDLGPYRVSATSFEYDLPSSSNLLQYMGYLDEAGRVESFHGGYYIMLDPLPVGSHRVFIGAEDADGTFEDRFTLEVYEPTPDYQTAPQMRDPSALTAGKSLAQWAEAWVQWFHSIPWSLHPARELTSWHCVQNQTHDVTFLGGVYGSTPCTVPSGKPIIMPILHRTVDTCGDSAADIAARTVASEELARAFADAGKDLLVQLDLDTLLLAQDAYSTGDFRVGLRTFPIEVPASDSLLAGRDGDPFTGLCDPTWMDGVFAVIEPLAPGSYNLFASGFVSLPDHLGAEPFYMETHYMLTVADEVPLAAANASHYGKTMGEWAAAFWQWAYALPATDHPLLDTTGQHCGRGQSGDVFFLGGTLAGTLDGPVERSCQIPQGKALLIPLINAAFDNGGLPAEQHLGEEELRANLERYLAGTRDLSLQIDAKVYDHDTLERHAVPVTSFAYRLPAEDSLYKLWELEPEADSVTSLSGGYYVLVEPLPPGLHHIRIKGRAINEANDPRDDFEVDVTYHLQIGAPAR